MKKIYAGRKFFSMLLCLFVSLTLFSTMNVSATSATSGSAAEYSEKATIGEVINSVEQGATGTYSIAASGYYLINLRGADGGDGEDVAIESDGMGNTGDYKGYAQADGGKGAVGSSISTLVYLKKGQVIKYYIGKDGEDYEGRTYECIINESGDTDTFDRNYRYENIQRGYIHIRPNDNTDTSTVYQPEEYKDAGFGGGGGEGTYVVLGDTVIAGAAGGGGGGGSVAACAGWGDGSWGSYGYWSDPSGFKSTGINGENAETSSTITDSFSSIDIFNGKKGEKSSAETYKTGDTWKAVTVFGKQLAPEAPKYELKHMTAGTGGSSGTSYINKDAKFYYGDNIPSDVSVSDAYINAATPQTSGIIITFVLAYEAPKSLNFSDGAAVAKTYTVSPDEIIDVEIPKPPADSGYFKGWINESDSADALTRDYYGTNTVAISYDDCNDCEYKAQWYDTSEMGLSHISNAKAQAVCISDGAGGKQNAIRFLALVDSKYTTYQKAGFIISANYPNPTIEAGYQYSSQYMLYKRVLAKSTQTGDAAYIDVNSDEIKNLFGFEDGAGLIYTNLVIREGNEDTVYYATPYIVNSQSEIVYGKSRAISFNQLKSYDTAIMSEQ